MSGVMAARAALQDARRPRGSRHNPALSCKDLRTSHTNMTDGKPTEFVFFFTLNSSPNIEIVHRIYLQRHCTQIPPEPFCLAFPDVNVQRTVRLKSTLYRLLQN